MKYPAVYKGSDYATGATGLAEGQPPVEESNLAEDTVEAQEQDYTDYQTQAVGHGSSRQNNFYQVPTSSLCFDRCHPVICLNSPVVPNQHDSIEIVLKQRVQESENMIMLRVLEAAMGGE